MIMRSIKSCLQSKKVRGLLGFTLIIFTILALFHVDKFTIGNSHEWTRNIWSSFLMPREETNRTARIIYDSDVKVFADIQFQYYKQNTKKDDFDRFKETGLQALLKYSVTYRVNENIVQIHIEESLMNGSTTKGGSYFYIKQQWRDTNTYYRSLCAMEEDYFNGSYSASCMLCQACTRVTIQRLYGICT